MEKKVGAVRVMKCCIVCILMFTYMGINDDAEAANGNINDVPLYSLYRVQTGDTLYGIATRFGSSVTELKRTNGLVSDAIYVGQKLRIPNEKGRHYLVQVQKQKKQ